MTDEEPTALSPRRICIVFDCLYPCTIGGGERYYHDLSKLLADRGYAVTYLTRRQWDRDPVSGFDWLEVIPVSPRGALYKNGSRRMLPPVLFGLGVLIHLLRYGHRYDAVHTGAFPYFSLIASAIVRPLKGYALVADWWEVWSEEYWQTYIGRLGKIGSLVQRMAARLPHTALCTSDLHAARLERLGRASTVYRGLSPIAPTAMPRPAASPPTLISIGRMIPEKRSDLTVDAFLIARRTYPDLRLCFIGDGPERQGLTAKVRDLGLEDAVDLHGFVEAGLLEELLGAASVLIHPSAREGYGKVVIEAAAVGVPTILAPGVDNAAVELIEPGVNGVVSDAATAESLATAISSVIERGDDLRLTTRRWHEKNRTLLSIEATARILEGVYTDGRRAKARSALGRRVKRSTNN